VTANPAGAAASEGVPGCGRCGSTELRRSHSRHALERVVRRVTPWERYACRVCGHHGWARGPLGPRPAAPAHAPAHAPAPVPRGDTPSGRKPEVRDHRLQRRVRTRTLVLVTLSLALGVLAALSLQRCGLPSPPGD
jgi:hypothetical protein